MTSALMLLEMRTYKRTHGIVHREYGSPETLSANVADDREALMIARLRLKLESAFRDANRLHLSSVANAIMAARLKLREQAKERLEIKP